ncbi:hypothetical protein EGW08_011262 [Elysia chlorotica]|uniref:C2H2-type domain-containing protein n=1 Tax=Elysia chlorotica TaxID=188477 RepID=A0A3S1HJY1_ELYCH|nr:hypothetical protein EGW08_011262 [Elysia chlorotica]
MERDQGAPENLSESKSPDDEWQIDSDWIDLSSSSPLPGSNTSKRGSSEKMRKTDPSSMPSFHFIPAPARAGQTSEQKFLVMDQQALRLSETKPSGQTYWVCSIPCCTARCILDPSQRKMVRVCRKHNHQPDVSRQEYKEFIHLLKEAVREKPHVKPKVLYEDEVEKARERFCQDEGGIGNKEKGPQLPSFEAVRNAMYNSRNAVLSSVSLRAAADEEEESLEDGSITPDVTPQGSRTSRSTRSRDGKKKSPTSKNLSNQLEDEWSETPHKNANLSDLEDWLEDDFNANISAQVAAVRASRGRAGAVRQSHGTPGRQRVKPQWTPEPDDGDSEQQEALSPDSSSFDNSENVAWDGISPLETIPKRKYRKRPASSSVFTCPHCPYKSNRHFNVQRHERLAHSSKKPEFSCKECGTSYSLEYRLKLHIKAVHQGEGHHCTICSRTFETMTGLKSHMVTKHKNEDPKKVSREPPPELTCHLCGRVFSTKSHLQKHTSSHIMVQPFRCCTCNQAFMEEAPWLSHQASCQAAFTIQCCLCSAYIPTARELMMHMDNVHGRSEYLCSCGKSFPWKKSLLTHQQKCALYLSERSAEA